MDHASHEELAKSNLRLRSDTAGAQRGKRKEKVGRGVSTRQKSSQNLGNVTAIVSGKGPKLVFSALSWSSLRVNNAQSVLQVPKQHF